MKCLEPMTGAPGRTLLYGRLAPAVANVENVVDGVAALRREAVRTVRLTLPRLAAELILLPRLPQLHAR